MAKRDSDKRLTDPECRAFACPPGKKVDRIYEDGMYLEVRSNGGRYWFLKYRFAGSEKRIALGVYPEVTLKDARARRDEMKGKLRDGIDPAADRRSEKLRRNLSAETGFESVAREWYKKQSNVWAPSHAERVFSRLERLVFPYIGRLAIAEIEPLDVLAVLRRIESGGTVETARRTREIVGQVFRYAVATGRAPSDPTRDLKGALRHATAKHRPAITDPAELRKFLLAIDGYVGRGPFVKNVLKLGLLTFQRPGELRLARWSEFDLDAAMWTVPAARMKRTREGKLNGQDHLVPLSQQAVAILRELHPLTGRKEYAFPSARAGGRPMSDMATSAALHTLGYKGVQTAHGFRATARTFLEERLKFRPEIVEAQLAHTVRDPLGRAYNRTTHIQERARMVQAWADYLDGLRAGKNAIPIHESA